MSDVAQQPPTKELPNICAYKIAGTGDWELRATHTTVGPKPWDFKTTGDTDGPLVQDHAEIASNAWHHLELGMVRDEISVQTDGRILATTHDSTHTHGQVGLRCDWSGADFASFLFKPGQY